MSENAVLINRTLEEELKSETSTSSYRAITEQNSSSKCLLGFKMFVLGLMVTLSLTSLSMSI